MNAAVIATLATVLTAFFCIRYKRRLRTVKFSPALLLIPVLADDEDFEHRVKSCYWEEAFSDPRYAKDIVLVIFEECANVYAARRLSEEYSGISVVHHTSLDDFIQRKLVRRRQDAD